MTQWSEGIVEANGLTVHYHRTGLGTDKPSLVLLHGFTDNGLCWSRVASDLQDEYDVIMPDARGHGRSVGPVTDMAVQHLAEDAAAFIRALGLQRPYLFGHSMGAVTALALAANHPPLVRAAVLEDPPFIDPASSQLTAEEAQQLLIAAQEGLAFQALPLADRVARGQADNPHWSDDEIMPWAASKAEYDPEIVNHRVAFRNFPWRAALSQVTCPMLLITADTGQGALVTPATAQEATRLGARCETVRVAGAGHCIHRDRYPETMQVVRDFLRRH